MSRQSVAWLSEDGTRFRPRSDFPQLPATDNEPGAPEALLKANITLRVRRWPPPFDRTCHQMILGDARDLRSIASESVHLVVTSPPYFNLKPYASDAGGGQLGRVDDYDAFLAELDRVWRECARVLVPGGRICCVIGDILIPRRADGRHRVLPLPSDIQVRSRDHGLDNLTPILWFKIGNRTNEARRRVERLLREAVPARSDHQERPRAHRDAAQARRLSNHADVAEGAVDVAARRNGCLDAARLVGHSGREPARGSSRAVSARAGGEADPHV
jgi:hypothetical protein